MKVNGQVSFAGLGSVHLISDQDPSTSVNVIVGNAGDMTKKDLLNRAKSLLQEALDSVTQELGGSKSNQSSPAQTSLETK